MQFENFWADNSLALSNNNEFEIEYFLPPTDLVPFINLFYVFRSDSYLIRDVQPASAGHVMFFLTGHGEARFMDGNIQRSHKITLIGPSTSAIQYIVSGPFHCIGVTFNPGGFSSLTGQKASKGLNKLLDATNVLGEKCHDILATLAAINQNPNASQSGRKMVDTLAGFLSGKFKMLKPAPTTAIEILFEALNENLDINLDEFYKSLPISQRQMQRFCKDYLGSSPKYLIRKFRAVRAAILLSDPDCSQDTRDIVQSLFYDQSHMIREISLFSGRTPRYLSDGSAPLLKMWFDSAKQSALTGIYSKASRLAAPNKG